LLVGVNALFLLPGKVGGTEIYLRSLLDAMTRVAPEHRYRVFINRETEAAPFETQALEIVPMGVGATNRPARIWVEQTKLVRAAHGCDVLFNPGFTAPRAATCPTVTVFHDLQHKRHPEYFRWWDLPAWNLLLGQAARSSTRLIAVSEATRDDLKRYYHRDATVVHHGVDERLFALERRPEKLMLCVSTLHPHKNLVRLCRVFAQFQARHADWRLVIAGMRGHYAREVEAAATAAPAGAVTITGWIPREELYSLYARAGAFIYPSTFEGFGMPVLEGLAASLPVACAEIAPLREVAGDAALYFGPADDDAMLGAMERLLAWQAHPERAREFSWERCARETLAVLEEARRTA
jgi:glycosyltransferase involved in cell wall biosynthesis